MMAAKRSQPGFRSEDSSPESAAALSFSRDAWGQLHLNDATDEQHINVTLTPLFPISDPHHWIAVCDADGRELACIADPEQLSPKSREIVTDELSRREFMPVIRRILHVSGKSEPTEWSVETDRGPTRFVLKTDENIRRLGEGKVAIVDANGVRYLIADLRALDARSRRVIEWYV
jgi:hypothetical protein